PASPIAHETRSRSPTRTSYFMALTGGLSIVMTATSSSVRMLTSSDTPGAPHTCHGMPKPSGSARKMRHVVLGRRLLSASPDLPLLRRLDCGLAASRRSVVAPKDYFQQEHIMKGRRTNGIGLAIVGAGRVGLFRGEVAARHPAVEWIGIAELNDNRGKPVPAKIGPDFVTT